MEKHWTEKLFIDAAHLFGADLEERVERAKVEVQGLVNIFSEFHVPHGGLVLDLACGIGRHSVPLAEAGFRVVGLDISPHYIARAKEFADEKGVGERVELRVGDMRFVDEVLEAYEEKFNAVINLYTSIGYYDEKTDKRILMRLLGLTAPEGVLVIETANRDRFIRRFWPRDIVQIGDNLVLVEERKLNLENSRMESVWKYYRKQKKDLKHLDTIETDHRVYSLHELKKLVEEGGWTYQTCYGGLNSEPFTTDSNRMVLIAQKL